MKGVRRLTAVLAAGAAMLASAAPAHASPALPSSMASTGDSITRAFDSTWWGCFLSDCPQYSWSTGTASTVNSQYLRIKAQNAGITGHNFNDAKTGAKMADLAGQMATAAGSTQHVGYVTVLMGANDVCTSSTATMTSTSDFDTQFSSALSGFFAADPAGLVYVSSLPNVVTLYNALKNNSSALSAWKNFNICQSALPPGGTDASRSLVYQQELAFNDILQRECGQYANCLYDGGAGFSATYSASCISTIDYFHPNLTGQAFIAQLTWAKSYWGNGVYRSAC